MNKNINKPENHNENNVEKILRKSVRRSFSPFFIDNVMAKLTTGENMNEVRYNVFKSVFRPLSIVTATFILVLAVYNIAEYGSFSLDALIGLPEITIDHLADAMIVE